MRKGDLLNLNRCPTFCSDIAHLICSYTDCSNVLSVLRMQTPFTAYRIINCTMICAISDDLPLPRPPLQTTCKTLSSTAARQTSWNLGGIKSDNLIDVVNEIHLPNVFNLVFVARV